MLTIFRLKIIIGKLILHRRYSLQLFINKFSDFCHVLNCISVMVLLKRVDTCTLLLVKNQLETISKTNQIILDRNYVVKCKIVLIKNCLNLLLQDFNNIHNL